MESEYARAILIGAATGEMLGQGLFEPNRKESEAYRMAALTIPYVNRTEQLYREILRVFHKPEKRQHLLQQALAMAYAYQCREKKCFTATSLEETDHLHRLLEDANHDDDTSELTLTLDGSFEDVVSNAINHHSIKKEAGAFAGALYGARHGLTESLYETYCKKVPCQRRIHIERWARRLARQWTIAIISPGPFSVPPVTGSSVEHDIEMVGHELKKHHHTVIYTKTCPEYPESERSGLLEYRRFPFDHQRLYEKRVIEDLKKLNPDVIQVENRPQYVLRIKKHVPSIPIVLNMHSMKFAQPPAISRKRAQKAMKQVDAMVTNSFFLQKAYENQFPVLKGKTYGVHLGIDPIPYQTVVARTGKVEYYRRKFGLCEKDNVILFVGRVIYEKGVHHLIRVLPRLIRSHPNIKILIVGSPKYGRSYINGYVKKLLEKIRPYQRHVILARFIRPSSMPYIYRLADVVVTPSVWKEPFGRVNLEAMSSGLPIITTKRGGIPEVVKNGENGYVIPLQKLSRELPFRIEQLLSSDQLRFHIRRANIKRVQHFTWSKTARKYLRIYKKLLHRRSRIETNFQ